MDNYLKIEAVKGKLVFTVNKEVSTEDFVPVAKSDDEGCAISFILMLAEESPWTLTRGAIKHTARLRIAYCYAPQIKAKIDELRASKAIPPSQLVDTYLWDLYKVYEEIIEMPIKGRTQEASDKAFKLLEGLTEVGSGALALKAKLSFNKALTMLAEM